MRDERRAYFESNVIGCFEEVLEKIFHDLDLELDDDYVKKCVELLLEKLKEHKYE